MPSSHLILHHPLLLLPPIPPSINLGPHQNQQKPRNPKDPERPFQESITCDPSHWPHHDCSQNILLGSRVSKVSRQGLLKSPLIPPCDKWPLRQRFVYQAAQFWGIQASFELGAAWSSLGQWGEGRWLPEEVWCPHQGQVPGMHVGLAAEGCNVGQVSNQVFQGPMTVQWKKEKVGNFRVCVKPDIWR